MARRASNDHPMAPDPQAGAPLHRWQAPPSSVDPTFMHAGPSRHPFARHDRPEPGWGNEPGWSTDAYELARPPLPSSYEWAPEDRDGLIPYEGFAVAPAPGSKPPSTASFAVEPPYDSTVSLMTTSAKHPHLRRTSAEEWQYRRAAVARHDSISAEVTGAIPPDSPPLAPTRPQNWSTPQAVSSMDPDPPRARVACSFCRVRKLRCDGAAPCRHCERRNIECIYSSAKGKAKSSARSPSKTQQDGGIAATSAAAASSPARKDKQAEAPQANGRARGIKRGDNPDASESRVTSSFASSSVGQQPSKRSKTASPRTSEPGVGSDSQDQSSPSSSMPGSDLAMIQNNDSPIPMEPRLDVQDDWWDSLLGMLSKSRSNSLRLVRHLLTRFIQSNAVFFGLLHAPTLLDTITGNTRHARADPALYLAVLAVSACDMHQDRIADERTSDMRSANEASRRLASRLSEMAATYLQTSAAHGTALSPSTGQAASILALTQPDGSPQQTSLVRLAENVVRTLKLHETVSSREPLLQDSEPDSPLYWSRPMTSDSPESEVKYESIVRLCWTGISHRFRRYIAKPDEEFGDTDLPEFILSIRPMAFWQPSLLPEDLPPPFFHSQDLMRRSAHLSRLTVTLAGLEKVKEVDETGSPSDDVLEKVHKILRALDDLERAFVRHRPRSEAERQNVLGRTLQMFCRMHVWVRLMIWRKYGLWSSPIEGAAGGMGSDATESGAEPTRQLFQQQHPTIEFWLGIVQEMIDTMQSDLDAHVSDQTTLGTSISDVDALARHVVCACQLIEASKMVQPGLAQVDAALSILKRVRAYVEIHAGASALQLNEDVVAKILAAEARRAALDGLNLKVQN